MKPLLLKKHCILFYFLIIGFIPILNSCRTSDDGRVSHQIGDNVTLSSNSPSGVALGATKEMHIKMDKTFNAKDELGFYKMLNSGEIMVVENNTMAKVLGISFARTEVRIMSGIHDGKTGFVSSEFIK